jgi:hypothetical protein
VRGVARGYSIAATGIRSLLAFLDSNEYFGHSDQMRQLFAKEYLEDFCLMYRDISPVDEACSPGRRPVPVSDNKIERGGALSWLSNRPDISCTP